jgi:hypothetical protein
LPKIALLIKGQCQEIFFFWFFHESVSLQPQSIPLGPFQIFSKIKFVTFFQKTFNKSIWFELEAIKIFAKMLSFFLTAKFAKNCALHLKCIFWNGLTWNDSWVLILLHVDLLAGMPQRLGAVLLDGVVKLHLQNITM